MATTKRGCPILRAKGIEYYETDYNNTAYMCTDDCPLRFCLLDLPFGIQSAGLESFLLWQKGLDLKQIAAERGVTYSTVLWQIRRWTSLQRELDKKGLVHWGSLAGE